MFNQKTRCNFLRVQKIDYFYEKLPYLLFFHFCLFANVFDNLYHFQARFFYNLILTTEITQKLSLTKSRNSNIFDATFSG